MKTPLEKELLAALEASLEIERLRDGMSECYMRLNDKSRHVQVETYKIARENLASYKARLKTINKQIQTAIVHAVNAG